MDFLQGAYWTSAWVHFCRQLQVFSGELQAGNICFLRVLEITFVRPLSCAFSLHSFQFLCVLLVVGLYLGSVFGICRSAFGIWMPLLELAALCLLLALPRNLKVKAFCIVLSDTGNDAYWHRERNWKVEVTNVAVVWRWWMFSDLNWLCEQNLGGTHLYKWEISLLNQWLKK